MESNYTSIKIDIEVFKLIQNNLLSFDETPNDILRRLLGLDKKAEKAQVSTGKNVHSDYFVLGKAGEVKLKIGTELRIYYKGLTFSVTVTKGGFEYKNEVFKSPSGVTDHVVGYSTDGWKLLHYQNSQTGKWEPITNLRTSITKRNRR